MLGRGAAPTQRGHSFLVMSTARVTLGQACASLRVAASQQRPAQHGTAQPALAQRSARTPSGLILPQGAAAGRGALSMASAATFPRGNDIYVPPQGIVQPMVSMQGEVRTWRLRWPLCVGQCVKSSCHPFARRGSTSWAIC